MTQKNTYSIAEDGTETLKFSKEYIWSDGVLVGIKITGNTLYNTSKMLYDENGELIGFTTYRYEYTNGETTSAYMTYFYQKDAQGIIRGIISADDGYALRFKYDAYGNVEYVGVGEGFTQMVLCLFTAAVNDFAYKDYMYDPDTKLYYLQSRFYNAEWGRFLNADSITGLSNSEACGEVNAYSYCMNAPVNFDDASGHCWLSLGGEIGHDKWEYPQKFNRTKVRKYIEKYVDKKGQKLIRNKAYYDFTDEGGDCANFVSQCLKEGGEFVDKKWFSFRVTKKFYKKMKKKTVYGATAKSQHGYKYFVSKPWCRVNKLKNYLLSSSKCKASYNINKNTNIKKLIKKSGVKVGDVLIQKSGDYEHSMIVSKVTKDDIKYSAHSNERFDYSISYALGICNVTLITIK